MRAYCHFSIRNLQTGALIWLAASAAVQLRGQGTVNFSNVGLANSFVYDQTSTPVAKAPVGTTFSVALYWSPYDPTSPFGPDQPLVQVGPSGHIGPLAG